MEAKDNKIRLDRELHAIASDLRDAFRSAKEHGNVSVRIEISGSRYQRSLEQTFYVEEPKILSVA